MGTELARERFNKAMKYLRMFLQDTPELNRLIRDQELSDEKLRFCIDMAISDFNSTMPPTPAKTIENYPSLYLLMHGSAINALKMSGMLQSRNELNYQTGGSSFVRSNKTNLYQGWLSLFINDYETKKSQMKLANNVERGYGGVHSEYLFVGRW